MRSENEQTKIKSAKTHLNVSFFITTLAELKCRTGHRMISRLVLKLQIEKNIQKKSIRNGGSTRVKFFSFTFLFTNLEALYIK